MRWTDRIADPWGSRTPYGRGEEWPLRVDQHLAEGVAEQDVDRVNRGRLDPKDLYLSPQVLSG